MSTTMIQSSHTREPLAALARRLQAARAAAHITWQIYKDLRTADAMETYTCCLRRCARLQQAIWILAGCVSHLPIRPASDEGEPQSYRTQKPGPDAEARYFLRPSGVWKVRKDGTCFCRRIGGMEWIGSVTGIQDLLKDVANRKAQEIPQEEGEP